MDAGAYRGSAKSWAVALDKLASLERDLNLTQSFPDLLSLGRT